jgi:hypothetical protein
MLSWVIQITVISIILIFLVHHLIHFFKSTLTVPKIKDLVNRPAQHYDNIYSIINNSSHQDKASMSETNELNNISDTNEYTLIDLLPKNDKSDDIQMKNELKNFLRSQLQD